MIKDKSKGASYFNVNLYRYNMSDLKLATIERIVDIFPHPDPEVEKLEIAKVLNFTCVVGKGAFKVGDLCILIQPDSVLPDAEWTALYKKYNSKRVKALQLKGVWSFGIVEKFSLLPQTEDAPIYDYWVGTDVTNLLGITKYIPPVPEEEGAIGDLPHYLIPTDEILYQNLPIENYIGKLVDITGKVDGTSSTYDYNKGKFGAYGRSIEFSLDITNKYTHQITKYDLYNKLSMYCETHKVNLALRGEIYGQGIQSSKKNPHSKLPFNIAFYSVWLIDEMRYAGKGEKHYFVDVCKELGLPTVDILEENVELTYDLIKKYDEGLDKVNGQPFEGVVVKGADFSFKIINKHYDSKK